MDTRDLEVLAWRLFEESNDAVFLIDPETETIQQANPTALRLTGLPWRQLRDRPLDELIGSDQPKQSTQLLTATRETGIFHSQEGYWLYRRQSEPLPINVSVSRVHVPAGSLGLIVARDISDRKRAERSLREFGDEIKRQVDAQTEELRVANEQLAAEIEERAAVERKLRTTNQQLRAALEQLERAQENAIQRERLHALEQITGGIAHDINNSLMSVSAFAEIILENDPDDQTRQWSSRIQTAAKDIAGIVLRLRQFNGHGIDPTTTTRIDLRHLAEEVVQLTRPKWRDESLGQRKDITVSLNAVAAPSIVGDPVALRSVLTNLIFNAADAIDGAGHIGLRITEESSMAILEVIDSGTGMTIGQRHRCLEPFYTTKKNGSGLGLSVCHGIVKSHRGRIEIDSSPGVGTTVRVLIPAVDTQGAVAAGDSESAPKDALRSRLTGKRILCVDDDQMARSSSEALLVSMGSVVDTAEDAPSGLALLRNRSYDAVLTDLSMPGMDGFQLTAEIKRLQPAMPVVVISGWTSLDERRATVADQPDSILPKPFSLDQLSNALFALLHDNSD